MLLLPSSPVDPDAVIEVNEDGNGVGFHAQAIIAGWGF
jgi:hypothetical protein